MDEEKLEGIIKQIQRFLIQRDRCRSEVARYMERKRICRRDETDAILEHLEQAELLDEERFARNRVEYRISQGYGPRYMEQEFRRLRIAGEVIHAVLEIEEEVLLDAARRVLTRKRGSLRVEDPRELNEKLARHLMSRGFSHQHTRRLLSGDLEALD